jgi:hypothetical protein
MFTTALTLTGAEMALLNETHDPALRSWIASANREGGDFPIQNLPFAVFRRRGSNENWRGGVAIGDEIIDLAAVVRMVGLESTVAPTAGSEQIVAPNRGSGDTVAQTAGSEDIVAPGRGFEDTVAQSAGCEEIVARAGGWAPGVDAALQAAAEPLLNRYMAMGPRSWSALRLALSRALREGAPQETA